MQTNLKLGYCSDTYASSPRKDFEENVFHQINTDLAESTVTSLNGMIAAGKTFHEAEAKRAWTESSNIAKMEFLADISHEIRTPLGAIIGLGRVLLTTNLNDQQKQCVTVLQSSAEALLAMITRTLVISRIESGSAGPENAPFDLHALLIEITSIMSVKALEKNIDLTLHHETAVARVFFGDNVLIRQILMNLVGNAIKFTDTGSVIISLARDENTDGVSISVKDTGVGIAEDKIAAVFKRFAQADSSIGRKYGGSGLGLSISKALAESMGGSIAVSSIMGQGSTFMLSLPLSAG